MSTLNVPNLLSLARLPLALAFLLLPGTVERAVIIAAAGASDWLDGWWARTRGSATQTGALLDPVTDKIFVVTALVTFVHEGVLPFAGLIVLLARDVFVTAGALIITLARVPLRLAARFPGKVVTTLQIIAVLALTVVPELVRIIVVVTALASMWAIADYAFAAFAALRSQAQRR